ncbi:MAG TPA: hypothetical protein PKC21_10095 [Oligoflexia bacterium]|nr:hypothetical protein [Oligoflexia bacterium]HMR25690.1 hypothetical protein [Oligoflexia bacterium]
MQAQEVKQILLLGKGYVTEFFKAKINHYFPFAELSITSRTKQDCIYFQLEDQSSWDNIINHYDVCVWTFPVYDLRLFQEFYIQKNQFFKKLILIGTTSSYKIEYDQQEVNEHSTLDTEHKRYPVENYFVQQSGVILRSAGIYGPEKNPIDWALKGKIKSSKQKLVNWVHVYDLVQFIAHTILYGKSGNSYIAADGCPIAWQEFYDYFKVLPVKEDAEQKNQSKKINNQWTVQQLKIDLAYPSILHDELKYSALTKT